MVIDLSVGERSYRFARRTADDCSVAAVEQLPTSDGVVASIAGDLDVPPMLKAEPRPLPSMGLLEGVLTIACWLNHRC